jgi:hypothetical protein
MIDNKLIAEKLREIADEVESHKMSIKAVDIKSEEMDKVLIQTTSTVSIKTRLGDAACLIFKYQEKL